MVGTRRELEGFVGSDSVALSAASRSFPAPTQQERRGRVSLVLAGEKTLLRKRSSIGRASPAPRANPAPAATILTQPRCVTRHGARAVAHPRRAAVRPPSATSSPSRPFFGKYSSSQQAAAVLTGDHHREFFAWLLAWRAFDFPFCLGHNTHPLCQGPTHKRSWPRSVPCPATTAANGRGGRCRKERDTHH